VTTAYRKVVVQLKPDFLGAAAWDAPELAPIAALFERARSGLSFHGATKAAVGRQLTRLPALPPFQRLLLLLRIFERLASSDEATPLRAECTADAYDPQEQRRMRALGRFVADEYGRKIELREAAAVVNLTDAAFCRFFKRMTRLTFTQFVNRYRVHQAQRLLLTGHTVTQAALACGFESVSYFNKVFRRVTGENPLRFRQRHRERTAGPSIR